MAAGTAAVGAAGAVGGAALGAAGAALPVIGQGAMAAGKLGMSGAMKAGSFLKAGAGKMPMSSFFKGGEISAPGLTQAGPAISTPSQASTVMANVSEFAGGIPGQVEGAASSAWNQTAGRVGDFIRPTSEYSGSSEVRDVATAQMRSSRAGELREFGGKVLEGGMEAFNEKNETGGGMPGGIGDGYDEEPLYAAEFEREREPDVPLSPYFAGSNTGSSVRPRTFGPFSMAA